MKKLAFLTLPLILAACDTTGGLGSSVVDVAAAPDQIVTVKDGKIEGTTDFSFTNRAGSKEVTISTATLTWKDATTGNDVTETVNLPAAVTLPAGYTCAAVATNEFAKCNYNDAGTTPADRTIKKTYNDSELFGKVYAANPAVANLAVKVRFNGTNNDLNFTFTSQNQTDGGGVVTSPPKPVVIVNNTSFTTDPTKPISNTLSVTVSANAASGVGVKKLILEITDSKGIVSTQSVDNTETFTFNVDTTKFPDGPLKLRGIAIDNQDRRGETTTVTTVQVANTVAPTIRVTSPTNNGVASGITPIVVQFQQNNTPFTFVNNVATIEIVDSGDRVITTQQASIVKVNEGLWEARTEIDLNAPQYVNGTYTVRAKADVILANTTTPTTIFSTSTFTNKSRVDEAPALNIVMPAYLDPTNAVRPVLTRKSAVFVQVSDSNNVTQVNLRFVCNQFDVQDGQTCNTNVYSYNIPVGKAGIQYRLFNTGILIDGEPYLPDGNYTMRATATDVTGLSSFREMRVRVSRNSVDTQIAGLGDNKASPFEVPTSKVTPGGANWTIQGTTANETRIVQLYYSTTGEGIAREMPTAVAVDTVRQPGSTISSGDIVFPAAGTYATSFLVQDLKTGVIQFYDGPNVTATPKE